MMEPARSAFMPAATFRPDVSRVDGSYCAVRKTRGYPGSYPSGGDQGIGGGQAGRQDRRNTSKRTFCRRDKDSQRHRLKLQQGNDGHKFPESRRDRYRSRTCGDTGSVAMVPIGHRPATRFRRHCLAALRYELPETAVGGLCLAYPILRARNRCRRELTKTQDEVHRVHLIVTSEIHLPLPAAIGLLCRTDESDLGLLAVRRSVLSRPRNGRSQA